MHMRISRLPRRGIAGPAARGLLAGQARCVYSYGVQIGQVGTYQTAAIPET